MHLIGDLMSNINTDKLFSCRKAVLFVVWGFCFVSNEQFEK